MGMYKKICVVCSKKYDSLRIDSMYCGDRCKNRSRSLPPDLKASLRRRNQEYMIKGTKYTAMVADNDGNVSAVGYEPKNATKENPFGDDYGLLRAQALHLLQQKKDDIERERLRQKYSTDPHHLGQSNNTNNDNSNNNTNTTAIEHPVVNTIPTDDSGFGSKNPDLEMLAQQFELPDDMIPVLNVDDDTPQQQEPQQKKYKFSGFKKQSA